MRVSTFLFPVLVLVGLCAADANEQLLSSKDQRELNLRRREKSKSKPKLRPSKPRPKKPKRPKKNRKHRRKPKPRKPKDKDLFDVEFELQNFLVPASNTPESDFGFRHMTATLSVSPPNRKLILFGGLGNGGPNPPTPMNSDIFTLNVDEPDPWKQEWTTQQTDDVVEKPWFTSTRGFVEIGKKKYLTCDDGDDNAVYGFDPETYKFKFLSRANDTLTNKFSAGDCCAVGHKVRGDERIYIMGGRNDASAGSPVTYTRYYSVTYDKWKMVTGLNDGRSHLGCVAVTGKNNKKLIYALGGADSPNGEAKSSIEVYDVKKDKWTDLETSLSEGRTRMAVQNVDDKYIMVIGGDATCPGGTGAMCASDQPLTTVEVIDIGDYHNILTAEDGVPQLIKRRQTPATVLREIKSGDQKTRYELYVIAGRTNNDNFTDQGVLNTTEILRFNGIQGREPRPRPKSKISNYS